MKICSVFLLTSLWLVSGHANYCAISSCPARGHIACNRSLRTFGPQCGQVDRARTRLPTARERAHIVRLHNHFRQRVARGMETRGTPGPQPPASNMRTLVWDNELASIAQIHAQQCVFKHECANTARFGAGQNLHMKMSSGPLRSVDWAAAVRSWYNEVKDFDSRTVRSFRVTPGPPVGHYTQVLWANTRAVGCGMSTYMDRNSDSGFRYRQLVVCNYGPAGNFIGQAMYKIGRAGSACPRGTRRTPGGLCA